MQALSTNKSFSGDNKGKVPCSLVLLHLWQVPGLAQLKAKVIPDWPTNNTRPNFVHNRQKRAIADDWTEGKCGSATE